MRQFPHSRKAGRYHSPKSKDRELPNILSALAKCCSPSDRFPATKASLSCICYTTPLNKWASLHWPRGQMNGRLRSTTSVDPFDFQLRIVAWTNSLDAYVQVTIDKLRTAQPPFCMIFYNSHPFRVAALRSSDSPQSSATESGPTSVVRIAALLHCLCAWQQYVLAWGEAHRLLPLDRLPGVAPAMILHLSLSRVQSINETSQVESFEAFDSGRYAKHPIGHILHYPWLECLRHPSSALALC